MADDIRLGDLLPDKLDDVEKAIEGDLRDTNGKRSTLAWHFIRSTAAKRLQAGLDYDAFRLVAHSWAKAAELFQYRDQPPGETAIVHLGEHKLTQPCYPTLVVDFGAPPYTRLKFTLEVTAHFDSAALAIQDGHIVSVEAGEAWFEGQLKYKDIKLHKRESSKVTVPMRKEFGAPGIKIC